MGTRNRTPRTSTLASTALASLLLSAASISAQTELLSIEFNEDDQAGFDLWPTAIAGSSTTALFATDSALTSGTTTISVTTSTGFGLPVNRGSMDGTPPGYSYQHLYEDLLHATSPTGVLSLECTGLNPNQPYVFTLYAWDPGSTNSTDKEWTVTEGTGVPPVASVNFLDPLVDNETFALVFVITTTGSGSFRLENTAGLPESAINGFKLSSPAFGTGYCLSVPNSTGFASTIWATGSASIAANDLVLTADNLPSQPGIFIAGPTQAQIPFFNGFLCVDPQGLQRFQSVASPSGGSITESVDYATAAQGGLNVAAGSSYNYQRWNRDPAAGSANANFSDGLEVLHSP